MRTVKMSTQMRTVKMSTQNSKNVDTNENRKKFPDGVIRVFHLHSPSDRTMALGSTQLLTEVSTVCISWG